MKRVILLLSATLLLLVLAACGGAAAPADTATPLPPTAMPTQTLPMATPTTAPSATSMPQSSGAMVTAATVGSLGMILVDANGFTLYHLSSDTATASTCAGSCAQNWPPVVTTGAPQGGNGITAGWLGTIARSDGTMQVTYHGLTLYRFAFDKQPGDAKGQGIQAFGGAWWVISQDGTAMQPAAQTPPPTPTTAPMTTPTQTAMMGQHGDLVLALHELNSSGQTGIVVLTANGDKTDVTLMGNGGISLLNHIHSGSCAVVGGVVYPLTNLDNNGTDFTTVNAKLSDLTKGGFAVRLHKATDPSVYTACADIPMTGTYLTVALNTLNASGQTGVASLVEKGVQTEVTLYATAAISQLNHIHSASCAVVGGVVYPLTNMANGVSVTLVNAGLNDLANGGYAIRLHKADNPAVYTSCGDIPKTVVVMPTPAAASTPAAITPTPASSPVTATPTPTSTSAAGTATVQASILNFTLPSLTVPVGTTVVWTQNDPEGHQIADAASGWSSGVLQQGQTFSHVFTTAGAVNYFCKIHASMKGTITVTASGTGAAASAPSATPTPTPTAVSSGSSYYPY